MRSILADYNTSGFLFLNLVGATGPIFPSLKFIPVKQGDGANAAHGESSTSITGGGGTVGSGAGAGARAGTGDASGAEWTSKPAAGRKRAKQANNQEESEGDAEATK